MENSAKPIFFTYLGGVSWVGPALLAWVFCVIFIIPKLKQAWFQWDVANMVSRQEIPGGRLSKWLYGLFDCADFFMNQGRFILVATGLVFLLLEFLVFRHRPGFRRFSVWLTAFGVNTFVLLALLMMVTLAVVFLGMIHNPVPPVVE